LRYKPKEGLALINGTAVSTGVAALAIHDAHCLAVASQVLTAMSVEALCGSRESFDPIFGNSRPHPGQIESAHNIHSFLTGSKLIRENNNNGGRSLYQDRYSIRTAAQWIGPVLEDLLLANQQVEIECNSTTDNPLIDIEREHRSWNGGNFQARVITSAMEKTRSGLQTLGQMVFAQCTELINPRLNFGLPPNLTADQPSESFLMKPIDIMIAALQSELGYLSNSAGSHVQSAEMGNQALNSLALISARYTHSALDVLCQLASAHALVICQAFDLRAMQVSFLRNFEPEMKKNIEETLSVMISTEDELCALQCLLWDEFTKALEQTTSMDSVERFSYIFRSLQPHVLDAVRTGSTTVTQLKEWSARCATKAFEAFENSREEYANRPDARPLLGAASRRMYSYIRFELAIPFLRKRNLNNIDSDISYRGHLLQRTVLKEASYILAEPEASATGQQSRMYDTEHGLVGEAESNPRTVPEQKGLADLHEYQACDSDESLEEDFQRQQSGDESKAKSPSVGSYTSIIYEAFRSGELYGPVFQCLEEAQRA
jgi:phenylalanine ammonia-lyase